MSINVVTKPITTGPHIEIKKLAPSDDLVPNLTTTRYVAAPVANNQNAIAG